jgi:Ca-activated chloride channel homolog
MPHFANPLVLLMALPLPLLVSWWLRRRRDALRYPAAGWLAELPAGRARVAIWGGAVLRGLALLSVIIALAGPRWPDQRTRIPAEGVAIVLLVDVSASMRELDFDWQGEPTSRLEAVKKVFHLFVEGGDAGGHEFSGRPEDLIGLAKFGRRPELPCPPTLSHSVPLGILDAAQPLTTPGEAETNFSDAIALGLRRLENTPPKRKLVILLSDGEEHVPDPVSRWTPRQAARLASSLGIPVYTIDAGGQTSSAARDAGIHALQEIAKLSGGRYFPAGNTQALLAACQEIDHLERTQVESFLYRRYYEGFAWFGLASFVLFVLLQLLELTVWRRLP